MNEINVGDFVYNRAGNEYGIVLKAMDRFPYIPDGCGSANYNEAETNFDVSTWPSFEAVVVFMLPSGKYEICNPLNLIVINNIDPDSFDALWLSTSMFDHATSGLRYHLTLLKMQESLMGKDNESI